MKYILELKNELFYNYRRSERELDEPVIFCTNDPTRNRHYGNILRIFRPTNDTLDLRKELKEKNKLIYLFIEFVKEWSQQEISYDEAEEEVNPNNIVDSARAWDNTEFINFLYDKGWFYDFDSVVTNDGAVFFEITDKNLVDTVYLEDYEIYKGS